ncbi:calcium/sodium antiporter [Anaerolentibacter hominis]|uniref:calcium/sodium antiporter n=1 Tax=Anaerolentibacter hominis TaxID=3079009 RepID=UPI0031B829CE
MLDQLLLYTIFIIGIILIIKGGDMFVDGAVWIADAFHIPKVIIGATIVSLATTLPELFVSAIAAGQGKVEMAIGNAVGSVIANTGLIMAIGIFFLPSVFPTRKMWPKCVLLFAAIAGLLAGSMGGALTLGSSLAILLVFILFLYENVRSAKRENKNAAQEPEAVNKRDKAKNILALIIGAIFIVVGSQILVDKGSEIARNLNVPENIIGLTAIAIGTSLPELVTTITAIIKKQPSLSVGNIIGANIIDTTMILPICALISGGSLPVASQTVTLDLPVALLITAIILIPAMIRQKFSRWQGVLALAVYIGYLGIVCF